MEQAETHQHAGGAAAPDRPPPLRPGEAGVLEDLTAGGFLTAAARILASLAPEEAARLQAAALEQVGAAGRVGRIDAVPWHWSATPMDAEATEPAQVADPGHFTDASPARADSPAPSSILLLRVEELRRFPAVFDRLSRFCYTGKADRRERWAFVSNPPVAFRRGCREALFTPPVPVSTQRPSGHRQLVACAESSVAHLPTQEVQGVGARAPSKTTKAPAARRGLSATARLRTHPYQCFANAAATFVLAPAGQRADTPSVCRPLTRPAPPR
uniref:Uncharacterized protein n=1 Tax=uncultured Armatimonadetes bacterium TaxID=157466 RepID=A0A6J4HQD4_9BACT|nr:hypothetical protein AVDCRST_MAG63-880 [uncultured Armatimonadetes bacterium]